MSEIVGIGAVEGLYGYENTEEDLGEALGEISLYLMRAPHFWATTAGCYIVIHAVFSTKGGDAKTVSFEKLREDMSRLSRKIFFTIWDRIQISRDIDDMAMENPTIDKKQLREALTSCLKALQKEVDHAYRDFSINQHPILGISSELNTIAQILSHTHLSPELRAKGEDLSMSFDRFPPGYGFQTHLFYQTEIQHVLDLLDKV